MCRNGIRKGKNGERGWTRVTTEEYANTISRPARKLQDSRVEQGNRIKTKKVYERVKGEVKRRINLMAKSELKKPYTRYQYEIHPSCELCKYAIACQVTKNELDEVDQIVKR